MTEILVMFIANDKSPLTIISRLKEDLELALSREEIIEYGIEIGTFQPIEEGTAFQLIHKVKGLKGDFKGNIHQEKKAE